MNLLTDGMEKVAHAIVDVDCPAGRNTEGLRKRHLKELTESDSDVKLKHALGMVEKYKDDDDHRGECLTMVYGFGGLHRWAVYADGTVKFSSFHACGDEYIKLAEQAGFEMH